MAQPLKLTWSKSGLTCYMEGGSLPEGEPGRQWKSKSGRSRIEECVEDALESGIPIEIDEDGGDPHPEFDEAFGLRIKSQSEMAPAAAKAQETNGGARRARLHRGGEVYGVEVQKFVGDFALLKGDAAAVASKPFAPTALIEPIGSWHESGEEANWEWWQPEEPEAKDLPAFYYFKDGTRIEVQVVHLSSQGQVKIRWGDREKLVHAGYLLPMLSGDSGHWWQTGSFSEQHWLDFQGRFRGWRMGSQGGGHAVDVLGVVPMAEKAFYRVVGKEEGGLCPVSSIIPQWDAERFYGDYDWAQQDPEPEEGPAPEPTADAPGVSPGPGGPAYSCARCGAPEPQAGKVIDGQMVCLDCVGGAEDVGEDGGEGSEGGHSGEAGEATPGDNRGAVGRAGGVTKKGGDRPGAPHEGRPQPSAPGGPVGPEAQPGTNDACGAGNPALGSPAGSTDHRQPAPGRVPASAKTEEDPDAQVRQEGRDVGSGGGAAGAAADGVTPGERVGWGGGGAFSLPRKPILVTAPGQYGSDEWLGVRKSGVGSSEAASVLGVGWETPLQVWAKKRGLTKKPDRVTDYMRWGHRLEPVIAEGYSEDRGHAVCRLQATYRDPEYPFMMCTPDYGQWTHPERNHPTSREGLLEIKSVNAFRGHAWEDGPPKAVEIQAQHQLAVTGHDFVTICAFVGRELKWWDRERHEGLIEKLREKLGRFWQMVEDGEEPPPSPQDDDFLDEMYPKDRGGEIELPQDHEIYYDRLEEARELRKAGKHLERACKAHFKAFMGDNRVGLLPSGRRIVWSTHTRKGYTVEGTTYRKMKLD